MSLLKRSENDEFYNAQVLKWLVTPEKSIVNIDNFVGMTTRRLVGVPLKTKAEKREMAEFSEKTCGHLSIRPFKKSHLYFDR